MHRRTVLSTTATALGSAAIGSHSVQGATSDGQKLIRELGVSPIQFLDDTASESEFYNEFAPIVDLGCRLYQHATDTEETAEWQSLLRNLSTETINTNPEAYNALLHHLQELIDTLSSLAVFPDRLSTLLNKIGKMASKTERVMKFLPFAWNLKQVLDVGCRLHDLREEHRYIPARHYVELITHLTLLAVEVVLLATGVGGAYKFASGVTRKSSQLLINSVGRRISWTAYSWILTLIHWPVRIVYADSVGNALEETTERVATALVTNSDHTKGAARRQAKTQVHKIAPKTLSGMNKQEYQRLQAEWPPERIVAHPIKFFDHFIAQTF